MRQGQRKHLALEDVWDLAESEKAVTAVANFQKWKSSSHHLGLVLLMSQWRSFLYSSAMSITSTLMQVAGPFFLYIIVGSIMDPANSSSMILYVSVCCLPLTVFVKGLLDGQTWHEGVKIGVRLKAVVVNEVYVKSLRRAVTVSAAANKASSDLSIKGGSFSAAKSHDESKTKGDDKEENDATVGRIVTLMSLDAEKIKESLPYVVDLLSSPVQIIVSILALLQVIGWPALAGLTVMLTTFPATYYLSEWANRVFGRLMDATDRRTNIVNDSLQGIRIIKYFAWERSFLEKIDEARDKEMRCLIDFYLQGATATFAWLFTPILVAFFTLLTITEVAGRQLDARMAFTCISLFYNLRFPMAILPMMIAEVFQLKVAFTRISHFLKQDELEKYSVQPEEVPLEAPTVGVRSGTFQWFTEEAEATPTADASTALAPSEQTTLLNRMSSKATVASFTLRNVSLTFPVGGLTAICGPTGAGKSSLIQALLGEMKRLSGRAYLPDPRNPVVIPGTNLTTGIAYVSQTSWLQNSTIRDNILFGEAYDTLRYTRVINACALTEDLSTLEGRKQRVSLARAVYSRAAFILLDDPLSSVDAPTARHVFDQAICGLLAGRTRILVTHQTALVAPRADFLVIIRAGEPTAAEMSNDVAGVPADFSIEKDPEAVQRLVQDEDRSTGAVKLSNYIEYISAAGGLFFLILLISTMVGDRMILFANDYWVKLWAEAYGNGTAIGAIWWSSGVGASASVGGSRPLEAHVVRCFGSYFASKKFNKALMQNIMFAPIRFFDTTPIGRILNRASKDLSVIDKNVMQSIDFFLTSLMAVLAVALVICSITPLFLGFMVPMMYLYYLVGTRYLPTSRELKRLESVTRSPIYSMLSETLTGCSTIRAFIEENLRRVDVNNRAYYFLWCSNRWLGVRISTIAAVAIFVAALIIVQSRDYIGAGFAGLALTWSLHANMEMSMNAVERVNEYLTLPQEAAMIIPTRRPPSSWPSGGAIEVKNLEMRYAPDLPPVLKNVSFSIKAGEKVGIVGRTGAGKSSLLLSIFRIFEPSAGSIVIDGVDVATIGLFDLRSRLTMIPQDPVLFAGTIRSNLDPFNEIEDDRIWRALERSTSDAAAASVTLASSSSSSSGASHRRHGLTIFDEATASVDNETDALIQETIRGEDFAGTTVLSIAHRLRTIADYDKVLVIEAGEVAALGSPYELMTMDPADGSAIFRKMCEHSGEFDQLLAIAKRAAGVADDC
ncbi:P-loop containing nucleoside triphosphate hydrolase protein [Zopfochytrium polystomum]|nr:P-loop containing nucleoside triphosphate hydrolase protein [Zopfochytrium polystomum]